MHPKAETEGAAPKNAGELEDLLAKSTRQGLSTAGRETVGVGELMALTDNGRTPIVCVAHESANAVPGRTTVDLNADHIGQQVVVLFENGDRERPIVIGVLHSDRTVVPQELMAAVDFSIDGERLIVSARRELVLQCGKSSITLQRDGTVRITGERIVSRATGANRVQGGSVELN